MEKELQNLFLPRRTLVREAFSPFPRSALTVPNPFSPRQIQDSLREWSFPSVTWYPAHGSSFFPKPPTHRSSFGDSFFPLLFALLCFEVLFVAFDLPSDHAIPSRCHFEHSFSFLLYKIFEGFSSFLRELISVRRLRPILEVRRPLDPPPPPPLHAGALPSSPPGVVPSTGQSFLDRSSSSHGEPVIVTEVSLSLSCICLIFLSRGGHAAHYRTCPFQKRRADHFEFDFSVLSGLPWCFLLPAARGSKSISPVLIAHC